MKKLNKYISTAAAALATGSLQAGVVYTDVNPDQVLDTDGDTYNIDMDGIGGKDFTAIYEEQGGGWGNFRNNIIEGELGNEIAGASAYGYSGMDYFANAYSQSSAISSGLNWIGAYAQFGWRWQSGGGYGGGTYTGGYWAGEIDKYVAVRFGNGGNTYYGWIRCDIGPDYDFIVIKDFAYEDTPGTPINAGASTNAAVVASNIVAEDIANNHNGLDLEVTFDMAQDESALAEYRVIAVKATKAANFGVADANTAFSYVSVTPNGGNHTVVFSDISKDSDGDLIVEDVPYHVFILSVPDLVNATNSNISEPSNEVTLRAMVNVEEQLKNLGYSVANGQLVFNETIAVDQLLITDVSGRVLSSAQNFNGNAIELPSSTGIYIINLIDGENRETIKLKL